MPVLDPSQPEAPFFMLSAWGRCVSGGISGPLRVNLVSDSRVGFELSGLREVEIVICEGGVRFTPAATRW